MYTLCVTERLLISFDEGSSTVYHRRMSLIKIMLICFAPKFLNFFKEIYCTENSAKYTRLQNCSFNQFAIVVFRRSE
jgi:hypothetical protein